MLPIPTENDWKNIALEFEEKWDFGNCIGAIDGKHCVHEVSSFYYYYTYLTSVRDKSIVTYN